MALNDIVAYKKALIKEKASSIEALKEGLKSADRSLIAALNQDRASFIFEVKPASPSKGVIRANADIGSIAEIYALFADAISVLADEKFFGGSLKNIQRVASLVKCPVLAKDVVVDPLQIIEARAYGAHAVLLMLSVLDDETYRDCVKVATDLNMDFITEVHTKEEMERANKFSARIIGINNRNLKTLEIDLAVTANLAPRAHKDALVISESGISLRSQINKLLPHADGFLVGSALMSAERIDLAVRELLFGRVKICGITNGEDAKAAYAAGAYYGGINFYQNSKRHVAAEDAEQIVKSAPLLWGGVFVNSAIEEVIRVAHRLKLNFVQIHGDESEDYLSDLRKQLPAHVEIWRALRVNDASSLPTCPDAERIVLDSLRDGAYGGTGTSFDWTTLNKQDSDRFILAGGINSANVKAADELGVFALDIASGVEDADPRKKSHKKLNEIFSELRPRGCL